MDLDSKNIQKQYEGFISTPVLWKEDLLGLPQLQLKTTTTSVFDGELTKKTRLGKRVESFVSHHLQQFDNITIVQENIQVQDKKLTIGELDCLYYQDNTPTHLEIIYKFYLYDAAVGATEIDHWIGPNRNDSLTKKLQKLIQQQLPLLYKDETRSILDAVDFKLDEIRQKVYFKAQLFIPYKNNIIAFEKLNKDCIAGFYIKTEELHYLQDCKFHIPSKLNWLVQPHTTIDWLTFGDFEAAISEILLQKTAPLCWLKKPNGELQK
ncbi:MAG: DUF1853 family protein, partial [Flavobacteriaceae bacterium]|nr:DUF1853 family protein [Flavobacteriaceae bacterium]